MAVWEICVLFILTETWNLSRILIVPIKKVWKDTISASAGFCGMS